MELSAKQAEAGQQIAAWFKDRRAPQVFRLFGYAGTGKSTCVNTILVDLKLRSLLMTYTGKAASVLIRKGNNAATIHSTIYAIQEPDQEKIKKVKELIKNTVPGSKENEAARANMRLLSQPKFTLRSYDEAGMEDVDLLVLDEVSMVDQQIGQDILSFGKKVLVLGDPGQLPPISGTGFFTAHEPDVLLTEVHRQASDSPVIRLATLVRQGHRVYKGTYGDSKVISRDVFTPDMLMHDSQIIVGRNRTRSTYNSLVRDQMNRIGVQPVEGDKLICLRNNRDVGLMNGTQWRTVEVVDYGNFLDLEIESWDDPDGKSKVLSAHAFASDFSAMTPYEKFRYNEFDFGYAITCHKSQGSQWPTVFIKDESWAFKEDAKRWLYTAITRAETRVTIVV